jgi:hypothetical protein
MTAYKRSEIRECLIIFKTTSEVALNPMPVNFFLRNTKPIELAVRFNGTIHYDLPNFVEEAASRDLLLETHLLSEQLWL